MLGISCPFGCHGLCPAALLETRCVQRQVLRTCQTTTQASTLKETPSVLIRQHCTVLSQYSSTYRLLCQTDCVDIKKNSSLKIQNSYSLYRNLCFLGKRGYCQFPLPLSQHTHTHTLDYNVISLVKLKLHKCSDHKRPLFYIEASPCYPVFDSGSLKPCLTAWACPSARW